MEQSREPRNNLYLCDQLIYGKESKNIQWGSQWKHNQSINTFKMLALTSHLENTNSNCSDIMDLGTFPSQTVPRADASRGTRICTGPDASVEFCSESGSHSAGRSPPAGVRAHPPAHRPLRGALLMTGSLWGTSSAPTHRWLRIQAGMPGLSPSAWSCPPQF